MELAVGQAWIPKDPEACKRTILKFPCVSELIYLSDGKRNHMKRHTPVHSFLRWIRKSEATLLVIEPRMPVAPIHKSVFRIGQSP